MTARRAHFWPLIGALVLGVSRPPQGPDTSEGAVLRAATAYVRAYQQQLTSVLADETYTQRIVQQIPLDANMPRARTLQSELFFMFAPSGGWMAIRDVVSVDGVPAAERMDIPDALRRFAAREVATKLKAYNSRFNLGRTFRNFNEPTLGLLVLDAEHRSRFDFDRKRVERTQNAVLVTIEFAEEERPTLIRDLKTGPVFSRGELTVEAATGRIRRTVLAARLQSVALELVTEYREDPRLGMWTPAVFREQYEYATVRTRDREYEKIVCEARYTNYRRFETSARVK